MQITDLLQLENFFRQIDSAAVDDLLDGDRLTDNSTLLGGGAVHSKSLVVACPNMPSWENAWWGERVLTEVEQSMVR
jgi:hypothetical protein